MPIAFLLALQASGMVIDYLGAQQQQEMYDQGAKLQRAAIDTQIQQNRLRSEDESLQAMKQLRKNMGTQLAVFAARGTNPAAGTAISFMSESLSNFNTDERMRRMNLLARENDLKAGKTISRLNQAGENTKLWQGFAQRNLSTLSSNPAAYGQMAKSFGLTSLA